MVDDPALPEVPMDRAARRFEQIRHLERKRLKVSEKLDVKKGELKAIQKEYDGVIEQILSSARDEGDLPLFFDADGEGIGPV